MNGVNPYVAWLSLWIRAAALSILAGGRLGFLDGEGTVAVEGALP